MRRIDERPLFTQTFDGIGAFIPEAKSVYVFGSSGEDRSAHTADWERRASGVRFAAVTTQGRDVVSLSFDKRTFDVTLLSRRSLLAFWAELEAQLVYIDYTGLAHHVWAPLVRSALAAGKTVRAVYVEPGSYRRNPSPRAGDIFDLSDEIAGLAPIPGFASLASEEEDSVFVPLLGFEGTRLAYLLEQVQPQGDKIVPLIGVPGFRADYPFHTYLGNRPALDLTKSWRRVRYARANCPFSVLYALTDIASEWPNSRIKVAPIGTKPHALGAVLFYLVSPSRVELVYDHPKRSSRRTSGTGPVNVFHISSLNIEPSRAGGLAR